MPEIDEILNFKFYSISVDETLSKLESDADGLSQEEVKKRLNKFGKNALLNTKQESIFKILWRQFKNPLIYILLVSSIIAISLGKTIDGLIVLGVVFINSLIGFIQEFQAGRAVHSLMKMVPQNATVLRNNSWISVNAEELVPGDIVKVISGDRVPADIRLFEIKSLRADESALTGESIPVEKNLSFYNENTALGDRKNSLFSGTYITYGQGIGVVTGTGANTELGKINTLIGQSVELKTPLTKSLDKLGNIITLSILFVSLVILVVSLVRNFSLADSILNAITLTVAAIPEGLPAIVTISLAIGVKRMAEKNAIIRKLPAVETLGSTTIICSDKTGTLTRNEMTVQQIFIPDATYFLTGIGYDLKGEFHPEPSSTQKNEIQKLLKASVLCNDATMIQDQHVEFSGDPTEVSLLVAAAKAGITPDLLRKEFPKTDSVPFESELQYMATLHQYNNEYCLIIKGAPEVILKKCKPNQFNISDKVSAFAANGLRVLAVASKTQTHSEINNEDLTNGFDFLGLTGMMDPPREEAKAAIKKCHEAGIVVKMITGDHVLTASSIGQQLNLESKEKKAISGIELSNLKEEEFIKTVNSTNVFARVAPEHKLNIVQSLQKQGLVVAMTGDGVNDAPALKQADIGITMGITGTDVSKESSDMVLKDDNFASIVSAVEEGRRVYDNLIKSLIFVLPTNLGLAVILICSVFFLPLNEGIPLQSIQPVQVLWINLITTVALALPLAFEKPEVNIMKRPPRKPGEPLLGKFVIFRTILAGFLMGAGSIGLFIYEYNLEAPLKGHLVALEEAQTISVTAVVMFQIFYLIHCRSFYESLKPLNIFGNRPLYIGIICIILLQLTFIYVPYANLIFGSSALNGDAWVKTILVSASIYPIISLEKYFRKKNSN